jgi:hypothetical protein
MAYAISYITPIYIWEIWSHTRPCKNYCVYLRKLFDEKNKSKNTQSKKQTNQKTTQNKTKQTNKTKKQKQSIKNPKQKKTKKTPTNKHQNK